jgi:integrase
MALLGAGQDVATVSGTLGHSSPAITLRVYSHALPSRKREAAERLDRLYGA